mmetsp:Transcript_23838/g.18192  ORF Transcript_23838/g.18192 Transcript_23838/m.18192 type:complete len:90 (-) Transcript_23838:29-298(-)|eukprot:CAMPEP_0202964394 /NCGR_PEP_ID=MMETSP1396-20130829/8472_1 /ASSEMBLY_ACC=CAM_ASM_000872 /TAXON_ID= /ORGANISM="Pseudokeronopsis sp., Strain Brazil" /LENGTH=89 /DNA_ID=CAMNT_0049686457 /DNA_START=234 /DNA_END=503 /DNA_ORIENTATION=+
MRKVQEKKALKRGKYKLKTKKAFQKRFRVCGALRDKKFKYKAVGYRHLQRNKTRRNRTTNKGYFLIVKGDIKKAKKMMPYFRRRKFLRC